MVISETSIVIFLPLMLFSAFLLVTLLLIFTFLEARRVKSKAEAATGNLRSCDPEIKEKLLTELDEKYSSMPAEYLELDLDIDCYRRSSVSMSSSSSSTSSQGRPRLNSQEAVEKMLHMLANPEADRRSSYEEAISMFTGEEARPQLRQRRGSRRLSWPRLGLEDTNKVVIKRQQSRSLDIIIESTE